MKTITLQLRVVVDDSSERSFSTLVREYVQDVAGDDPGFSVMSCISWSRRYDPLTDRWYLTKQ